MDHLGCCSSYMPFGHSCCWYCISSFHTSPSLKWVSTTVRHTLPIELEAPGVDEADEARVMELGLLQQLGQRVLAWLHCTIDHEVVVAVAAGAMGTVKKFLAPGMTLVLELNPALQTRI
jgi:hypothetical protein